VLCTVVTRSTIQSDSCLDLDAFILAKLLDQFRFALKMHSSSLWPVQRARLQNSCLQQKACSRCSVRVCQVSCHDSTSGSNQTGCSAAAVTVSVQHAAPGNQSPPGVVEPHPAVAPAPSQAPSFDAIQIRRRARDARRAGNPQLALELLEEGLQQYPNDAFLAVAAASAAAKLGAADHALQLLSPFLQQQPNNANVLTAAAAAYRAKGDLSTARRCYHSAAAAAPTNEVVLQAWGVLEAAAGQSDAARALFRQSAAVQPRHMPAYVAWAQLEVQAGNVQAARSLHQQAHNINPLSVPNLHVSGLTGVVGTTSQWACRFVALALFLVVIA
jgi:Tfp pilus assembly protein PilF